MKTPTSKERALRIVFSVHIEPHAPKGNPTFEYWSKCIDEDDRDDEHRKLVDAIDGAIASAYAQGFADAREKAAKAASDAEKSAGEYSFGDETPIAEGNRKARFYEARRIAHAIEALTPDATPGKP